MGLVEDLTVFYLLAVGVGLLSEIAEPARQAMIADLLPEEQRAEGFGILRVAGNLAWILGPTIGGLLATKSYLILFILDAVASLITAAIVYRFVPETKPESTSAQQQVSIMETLAGYRQVATDRLYLAFIFTSMLMTIVYLQMYQTLSVYLRDVHGISEQRYGLMLSLDAGTVVLFQIWVARIIRKYPPMIMMALGTAFYLVGFTMFGIVNTYFLFVLAILIITVGEMIVMPVGNSLAALFAPEEMRGRYMAFFGLSWTIPSAVGSWAAGLIMDNYNPNWVWYACGIISAMAVVGFYILHLKTSNRFAASAAPMPDE